MADRIVEKRKRTWRRQKRVRKNLFGTSHRPRVSVFRSHKHIYAQIVDDLAGKTLCSASSKCREISEQIACGGNIKAAKIVGATLGQRAIMHGIKKVVFDRGPYKYHGRIKTLAESAKAAGLEF